MKIVKQYGYRQAHLAGKKLPRWCVEELEKQIGLLGMPVDNHSVVVFRDGGGGQRFAVMFADLHVVIGDPDDVVVGVW